MVWLWLCLGISHSHSHVTRPPFTGTWAHRGWRPLHCIQQAIPPPGSSASSHPTASATTSLQCLPVQVRSCTYRALPCLTLSRAEKWPPPQRRNLASRHPSSSPSPPRICFLLVVLVRCTYRHLAARTSVRPRPRPSHRRPLLVDLTYLTTPCHRSAVGRGRTPSLTVPFRPADSPSSPKTRLLLPAPALFVPQPCRRPSPSPPADRRRLATTPRPSTARRAAPTRARPRRPRRPRAQTQRCCTRGVPVC